MLSFTKKIVSLALLLLLVSPIAMAANSPSTGDVAIDAGKAAGLLIVGSPNDCGTRKHNGKQVEPVNCIFLLEPIGGKPGYDLYLIELVKDKDGNVVKDKDGNDDSKYILWDGGAIPQTASGPVQALLSSEPGKEYQGPFGLLYNYLGLVYGYMSGLIVGIAVLFVVIGGIQMSTSGGDTEKFSAGKSRITKAIVGMILWFTASLILYTINPTFFAF